MDLEVVVKADAATIGDLVRGHWGIETRLHWVHDVVCDEDRSPVRTEDGPRVMDTVRNTVMSLLRRMEGPIFNAPGIICIDIRNRSYAYSSHNSLRNPCDIFSGRQRPVNFHYGHQVAVLN